MTEKIPRPTVKVRQLSWEKFFNFVEQIEKFFNFVEQIENPDVIFLKNKEVVQWLFGDHSFLFDGKESNKNKKQREDEWGINLMKTLRSDLKFKTQWTNVFGESIVQEVFILSGNKCKKCEQKQSYHPDLENEKSVIEVKTQTYYTSGTAAEKILGCPFKYAEVPEIYKKPLKIVCVGGAEKICRENFGILGKNISHAKQLYLEFFKERKIEYVGITELLQQVL